MLETAENPRLTKPQAKTYSPVKLSAVLIAGTKITTAIAATRPTRTYRYCLMNRPIVIATMTKIKFVAKSSINLKMF